MTLSEIGEGNLNIMHTIVASTLTPISGRGSELGPTSNPLGLGFVIESTKISNENKEGNFT